MAMQFFRLAATCALVLMLGGVPALAVELCRAEDAASSCCCHRAASADCCEREARVGPAQAGCHCAIRPAPVVPADSDNAKTARTERVDAAAPSPGQPVAAPAPAGPRIHGGRPSGINDAAPPYLTGCTFRC